MNIELKFAGVNYATNIYSNKLVMSELKEILELAQNPLFEVNLYVQGKDLNAEYNAVAVTTADNGYKSVKCSNLSDVTYISNEWYIIEYIKGEGFTFVGAKPMYTKTDKVKTEKVVLNDL